MPCPNSEQYSLDKFSRCVYFCRFCYAWWVFTRSGINKWGQLGKWTGQKPFSRSSWFPYKTTHFFQPKKKRNWKRHRWQQKNKKSEQKTKLVWKMCVVSLWVEWGKFWNLHPKNIQKHTEDHMKCWKSSSKAKDVEWSFTNQ